MQLIFCIIVVEIFQKFIIMLGAIIGDTVGSIYEFDNIKTTDFPLFSGRSEFTDDSVMSFED